MSTCQLKIQNFYKKLAYEACLEGDIQNLSYLILDMKVEIKDEFLHGAMKSRCNNVAKKQIIDSLIGYGADINSIHDRKSLLGSALNDIEMVTFLLELGIDINLRSDLIDNLKDSNMIRYLIEAGFRLNPDILIKSVNNGNYELSEYLINLGDHLDINYIDKHGYTALIRAAGNNNLEIVKLLLNHPLISSEHFNAINRDGDTALTWVIGNNNLEIVKLILNHPLISSEYFNNINNENGDTALNGATFENKLEIVKLIINHPLITSEHFNAIDIYGNTALSQATENNNLEMFKLILNHPLITSEHLKYCLKKTKKMEIQKLVDLINEKIKSFDIETIDIKKTVKK